MSISGKLYHKLPMRAKKFCSHIGLFRLYRTTDRFKVVEVDGVKFNVDVYTYVGSSLYHLGVYEKDVAKIIDDYLEKGDVAIDVGSSIGAHALRMAHNVGPTGKVYTFEPSKILYSDFFKNVSLNGFENVVAENMGLSNKNEVKPARMERLGRLDGLTPEQPYENATFVALDSYVKKHNIPKIKLIKIDTDGAEADIIKGALKTIKRDKPYMVIEFRRETVRELIWYLTKVGYSFYDTKTFEELPEHDLLKDAYKVPNIFCRCENVKKKN